MRVEVVRLPTELKPEHLRDRAVVVLDVLRATTSMIAALNAGAREIRIFQTLDAARAAARGVADAGVLCGETQCRKPGDFDLGNSPGDFTPDRVRDRTLFMSTTNGTRAILAARGAPLILIGALVNAAALAQVLRQQRRDVTLLCAGTNGQHAPEDEQGAAAIRQQLLAAETVDVAVDLPGVLRRTRGGLNIIAAGLEPDIDFAARLNVFDVVGVVRTFGDDQIAVHRYVPGV
jgi:2-phosphosulfolactate phosphatase